MDQINCGLSYASKVMQDTLSLVSKVSNDSFNSIQDVIMTTDTNILLAGNGPIFQRNKHYLDLLIFLAEPSILPFSGVGLVVASVLIVVLVIWYRKRSKVTDKKTNQCIDIDNKVAKQTDVSARSKRPNNKPEPAKPKSSSFLKSDAAPRGQSTSNLLNDSKTKTPTLTTRSNAVSNKSTTSENAVVQLAQKKDLGQANKSPSISNVSKTKVSSPKPQIKPYNRPPRDEEKEAEQFQKELKEAEKKAEEEAKSFMRPIHLNIDKHARSKEESQKSTEREMTLIKKLCGEVREIAKSANPEEREERKQEMDKVRGAR